MKGRMGKVTRSGCLWDSTLEHIVYTYEDGDVFLILDVPHPDRPYFPVLVKGKIGWLLDSGWRYL